VTDGGWRLLSPRKVPINAKMDIRRIKAVRPFGKIESKRNMGYSGNDRSLIGIPIMNEANYGMPFRLHAHRLLFSQPGEEIQAVLLCNKEQNIEYT
jgi:hypothetical protein